MKLCIALDMATREENLRLIRQLSDFDGLYLKVGLRSFIRDGVDFLDDIKKIGNFNIFLDLKLYDIPNTMCDSIKEIAAIGVDMITIHASSGIEAMSSVMNTIANTSKAPIVMAVTALTSFDNDKFYDVYNMDLEACVLKFARLAYDSGINGVVCSCLESKKIKTEISNSFLTLTPGIRPFGESVGDQKRVATIQEAYNAMSDFIVVGRPIYKSEEPRLAVENILKEMNKFE